MKIPEKLFSELKRVHSELGDILNRTRIESQQDSRKTHDIERKRYGRTLVNISNIESGFATGKDPVFIADNVKEEGHLAYFNGHHVETSLLKPIFKHDMENSQILFPYTEKEGEYELIPEKILHDEYRKTYEYFFEHKEELLKRVDPFKRSPEDKGDKWYKLQAFPKPYQVNKKQLAVYKIFNDKIDMYEVGEGIMVATSRYIAITSEDLNTIKDILHSKAFLKHAEKEASKNKERKLTTKIIEEYILSLEAHA